MIDNTTLVLPNPGIWYNRTGLPFKDRELQFVPKYNSQAQLVYYESFIKNLRLKVLPSEIWLNNSPHKLFHGNNSGDYTSSQIIETFDSINDITGLNWWDSSVKKIEYGCNLIDIPTDTIISGLMGYGSKSFLPMVKKGKQYGIYCAMDLFWLKFYNKTLEVLLHEKLKIKDGISRWEIPVDNMRYLTGRSNPIQLYKLSDLKQPKIMEALATDLIEKFNKSQKRIYPNFKTLPSLADIRLMACMENSGARGAIKAKYKDTWKNDQKKYKKINCSNDGLYLDIVKEIKQKCEALIYG